MCQVLRSRVHLVNNYFKSTYIKKNKRSLHTESDIFIRNVRTLKNKYDLSLCQSHLYTASESFIRNKEIRIEFDFLRFFRISGKLFFGA